MRPSCKAQPIRMETSDFVIDQPMKRVLSRVLFR